MIRFTVNEPAWIKRTFMPPAERRAEGWRRVYAWRFVDLNQADKWRGGGRSHKPDFVWLTWYWERFYAQCGGVADGGYGTTVYERQLTEPTQAQKNEP